MPFVRNLVATPSRNDADRRGLDVPERLQPRVKPSMSLAEPFPHKNGHASPREGQLVEALALGLSLKEAAKCASISYATAKRWWKTERIRAAVERRHSESFAAARAIVVAGAADAARALSEIAAMGRSDSARVQACRTILSTARELVELASLDARISALESAEGDHRE